MLLIYIESMKYISIKITAFGLCQTKNKIMKLILKLFPFQPIHRAVRPGIFVAALVLSSAASVMAQDKATLDLLVKKGVITREEEDALAKSSGVVVEARNPDVQKLKLQGMVQFQYDWVTTKDQAPNSSDPAATNQFELRHVYFGAQADLGNGWGGEIQTDFAATGATQLSAAPQSQNTQNLIEKAIITKKFDGYGQATFGFQKTQYSYEENTLTSEMLPVERSIATNYFTRPYGGPTIGRLGFGNRLAGIYWDGVFPGAGGFYYGGALTTDIESAATLGGSAAGAPSEHDYGYWAHAGYQGKAGDLTYKAGVNFGYAGDANSVPAAGPIPAQNNSIWGYNPYVSLSYDRFALTAEFLQAVVQNGRATAGGFTSDAAPYGLVVTPSYKINDQWELVTRFSELSTNGRGATISQQEWSGPNTAGAVSDYDNVWAAYLGFNWYISGNSVKLTGGYEYARFSDRQTVANGPFNGPRADVSAFRMRLQVVF